MTIVTPEPNNNLPGFKWRGPAIQTAENAAGKNSPPRCTAVSCPRSLAIIGGAGILPAVLQRFLVPKSVEPGGEIPKCRMMRHIGTLCFRALQGNPFTTIKKPPEYPCGSSGGQWGGLFILRPAEMESAFIPAVPDRFSGRLPFKQQ